MPGMTGFELAQMIKERKKTAQMPIIFLTAYYNEDQHVLEGYGSGAVDYLHKPINATVLRSKVAIFANLYRQARELERINRRLAEEAAERREAQRELQELNRTLEQRVKARTKDLVERTRVLEAAQEQLRASAVQFQALSDAAPGFIWSTDAHGSFTYISRRFEIFTGSDPGTVALAGLAAGAAPRGPGGRPAERFCRPSAITLRSAGACDCAGPTAPTAGSNPVRCRSWTSRPSAGKAFGV